MANEWARLQGSLLVSLYLSQWGYLKHVTNLLLRLLDTKKHQKIIELTAKENMILFQEAA